MESVTPITLYRGRSIAFLVNLVNDSTGLPVDLTPYTEIAAEIPAEAAGPCVTALFTLAQIVKNVPASNGQILVKFTSVQTLAMAVTDPNNPGTTPVTIYFTDPTNPDQDPYILVLANIFNVIDPPC